MPLSLKQAEELIAAAHKQAVEMGIKVAVAVLDEGGHLQALGRMDGAFPLSAQIAESKAAGAALWHRDGASLVALQGERPALVDAVGRLMRTPLIPALGSALIVRDDTVLGAVGVSGAGSEEDLECARAGLRAVMG
jgi:uncharacterized protein GlcG (DUF336 family)